MLLINNHNLPGYLNLKESQALEVSSSTTSNAISRLL